MSSKPARTKPQFATGPQKWVVLGPTGLLRKALSAVDMANDFSKDSPHQLTESSEKETKALALSEPNMIKG